MHRWWARHDLYFALAEQCYFYGGPAVWEARGLLLATDTSLWSYAWEDSCGSSSSKMGESEVHAKESTEEIWDYRLKPNLFHGDKTATITLQLEETGQVEIYNIQGAMVGSYRVEQGINVLNLKSLSSSGVYIYKVYVGHGLVRTDKLVVVE